MITTKNLSIIILTNDPMTFCGYGWNKVGGPFAPDLQIALYANIGPHPNVMVPHTDIKDPGNLVNLFTSVKNTPVIICYRYQTTALKCLFPNTAIFHPGEFEYIDGVMMCPGLRSEIDIPLGSELVQELMGALGY